MCANYVAKAWLTVSSAFRLPDRSDWRETRDAAERAIAEVAAIPAPAATPYYAAPLTETRRLIAESAAHLR
jgi:hypothetical protein